MNNLYSCEKIAILSHAFGHKSLHFDGGFHCFWHPENLVFLLLQLRSVEKGPLEKGNFYGNVEPQPILEDAPLFGR